MKYFLAVAEQESFTEASRVLKISQPAVSKMVLQMEEELGLKCFQREGKKIQLTHFGSKVLGIFKEIEEKRANLEAIRSELKEGVEGTVTFGASDNLLSYVLPPVIDRFLGRFPKVNFNLFSGASNQIKTQLFDQKLEFAIFYTPLTSSERKLLNSEVIHMAEFVLVMSHDLFERISKHKFKNHKILLDEIDLSQLKYLGSIAKDYQENNPAAKLHYEHLGLKPIQYIQANNHEVVKRLMLQGLGYTVIPKWMVEKELESGEVIRIHTHAPMISKIHLIKRKSAILSRPAREFLQILRKNFRERSRSSNSHAI